MNENTFKKVLISSASKMTDYAGIYGVMYLRALTMFKIFGNLRYTYSDLTDEQRNDLDLALRHLQANSKYICDYRETVALEGDSNTPPVISDSSIEYDASYYSFRGNDFTTNYTDADGDSAQSVKILSLPVNGDLTYNEEPVEVNDIFELDSIYLLRFTRNTYSENTDTFTYKVSDNNPNSLFSNMATFTINISESSNQPPSSVGALTLSIDNRATHTFSVANFTTDTVPQYVDLEGDPMSTIKITSLPTNGLLKLNNLSIAQNQIVTSENISSSLFKYVANDDDASYTDNFAFSISDLGSGLYTPGGTASITAAVFVNLPPEVGDGSSEVAEGDVYTFTRADFTTNTDPAYSDPEGDAALNLKVVTIPLFGKLRHNGAVITTPNYVVPFADIDNGLLIFTQDNNVGGSIAAFDFEIEDTGSGQYGD